MKLMPKICPRYLASFKSQSPGLSANKPPYFQRARIEKFDRSIMVCNRVGICPIRLNSFRINGGNQRNSSVANKSGVVGPLIFLPGFFLSVQQIIPRRSFSSDISSLVSRLASIKNKTGTSAL